MNFSAITLWTVALLCGLITVFMPRDYVPQDSYKTREYYPATIVDIRVYNSCSKMSCYEEYLFNLELDDGSIVKSVSVSNQTASEYKLGDTIRLERHITDPKIRSQTIMSTVFVLLTAVFGIFGVACILSK